eukprot:scaffold803_cov310-Pinguiococcus_pyrenoidosus.AAC.137
MLSRVRALALTSLLASQLAAAEGRAFANGHRRVSAAKLTSDFGSLAPCSAHHAAAVLAAVVGAVGGAVGGAVAAAVLRTQL